LRKGYVNDLAVLDDGTCVSVLDDGHVQLWKHAAQQDDIIHLPGGEGPVNSVVALKGGGFATAGRGCVQWWSNEAEPVVTVRGAMAGTTPASLTVIELDSDITCLAARLQITRQSDPQQFRLPPQNDVERLRRARAEAQEEAIHLSLARASRSVQVWYNSVGGNNLQTQVLEPPTGSTPAAVTCLTSLSLPEGNTKLLIAGDEMGGIRLWKVQHQESGLQFEEIGLIQLKGSSIVCMEPLSHHRLAVSTESYDDKRNDSSPQPVLVGSTAMALSVTRAVHILDLSKETPTIITTLAGHDKDAVICMCELPNGDILTGGGKLDATVQLWQFNDDDGGTTGLRTKSDRILSEVGYVFAMTLLPDSKRGSNHYAVAAARYNTIKLII
jgi:WD40 repeat protein